MPSPRREFPFSIVGGRLAAGGGILPLMADMGRALADDPGMRMLGGGNPAAVPAVQALVRHRMEELLAAGPAFDRMMVNYDPPRGNPRFLSALAGLLRREYGWDVGPDNIAVTSGGQAAFFFLFNLLGGAFPAGHRRRILLPLCPEYVGYADQGLDLDLFLACRPAVERGHGGDPRCFKYRIDFAAVERALAAHDVGAIAVSRPTNPSGNVLTDAEVARLAGLAADRGVPLIVDNAYGAPFPDILCVPARPFWADDVILTMSLSKLGLPGTRTGIVVAPEPIAAAVAGMTAIVGLANGTIGQQVVLPWVEDGSILRIGREHLQPFYAARARAATDAARESLDAAGVDWALHAQEGAFFHWLWLPGLRIPTLELYERLKARRVLTVPGEHFFFGLEGDWPHSRQCLRLNVSGPADTVREAYQIIATEAARAAAG